MTRVWHWPVLGVLLLAVWLVGIVGTGDPAYRAGFLGYAVLVLLLGVLPVVPLMTLVRAGVPALARRRPAPEPTRVPAPEGARP